MQHYIDILPRIVCDPVGGRKEIIESAKTAFFAGNGGSAAIASHMAADWQKAAGRRATCFNDAAYLTALANDTGYENVFAAPIMLHARPDDTLFAISSSGRSASILNAITAGRKKGMLIVTLSGFDEDNPLRKLGDINFYVPSHRYGVVEMAHFAILHSIVDEIADA